MTTLTLYGKRHSELEMQEAITRNQPIRYKIKVQGQLNQYWSEYLGEMDVSVKGERERAVSTLKGEAVDQAALMGLLNNLYDLGFCLLSVECRSDAGKEVA